MWVKKKMVVTFKFLSEFTEIMYNRKLDICIFESILEIQVNSNV